jgi:hypothetical protein
MLDEPPDKGKKFLGRFYFAGYGRKDPGVDRLLAVGSRQKINV